MTFGSKYLITFLHKPENKRLLSFATVCTRLGGEGPFQNQGH